MNKYGDDPNNFAGENYGQNTIVSRIIGLLHAGHLFETKAIVSSSYRARVLANKHQF
jgi:hypothetical protein